MIAFAKKEHFYINAWVKYNLNIGVSHFYIINNDEPNDTYLCDYIENKYKKYVYIFEARGTIIYHLYDENGTFNKYKHLYDWMAY